MIRLRKGEVTRILSQRAGVVEALVSVDGTEHRAVAYPELSGRLAEGDRVTLNTTATALGLGSGGYDFVMAVDGDRSQDPAPEGHLMKLRYTPLQVKVLSVEEEQSPHRAAIEACESLAGTPVVVATLHSQLAPACLAIRHCAGEGCRVVHVMTDGAALPLAWSRTSWRLREEGLVSATVTVGHAFGGDFEAVNKYSGLLAAKAAGRADVIVVAMGPGIVGTGTTWGHSGLEQGEWINAVEALGGYPIAVPRLSFADQRPRQQGVSHHFVTALTRVARVAATVPVPSLSAAQADLVHRSLEEAFARPGCPPHEVVPVDTGFFANLVAGQAWAAQSMGRGFEDDPAAFLGAAAAGRLAAERWSGGAGVSG